MIESQDSPVATKGPADGREDNSRSRPFDSGNRILTVFGALVFLAIVCLWGIRSYSVLNVPNHPEINDRWGMEDFREAVYFPVRSVLDGNNPYDAAEYLREYPVDPGLFVYAPSTILFNLPFGLLPYQVSEIAYFVASAAMIPLLAILLLRCAGAPLSTTTIMWLAVFIAAGRPVYSTLTLGQGSLFTVFGVITALHFARSRPLLSGLGIAIATMKPTFAIPLGLLMFFRRDYRALTSGIVIAGITCFIPTLVLAVSAGGVGALATAMTDSLHHYSLLPDNALEESGWMRVNASIALVRLFGVPPVPFLGVVVAFVGLGVAALAINLNPEPETEIAGHSLSSAIITLATLVAVHHLIYDAILVFLPMMVVLLLSPKCPWDTLTISIRYSIGGLLICVWFNYLATAAGLHATGLDPGTTGWRLATSFNSVVLLIVFLFSILLAFLPRLPRLARTALSSDPDPKPPAA
jgi:hypothetical protein